MRYFIGIIIWVCCALLGIAQESQFNGVAQIQLVTPVGGNQWDIRLGGFIGGWNVAAQLPYDVSEVDTGSVVFYNCQSYTVTIVQTVIPGLIANVRVQGLNATAPVITARPEAGVFNLTSDCMIPKMPQIALNTGESGISKTDAACLNEWSMIAASNCSGLAMSLPVGIFDTTVVDDDLLGVAIKPILDTVIQLSVLIHTTAGAQDVFGYGVQLPAAATLNDTHFGKRVLISARDLTTKQQTYVTSAGLNELIVNGVATTTYYLRNGETVEVTYSDRGGGLFGWVFSSTSDDQMMYVGSQIANHDFRTNELVIVRGSGAIGDTAAGARYLILDAGVPDGIHVIQTANGKFAHRLPYYYDNRQTGFFATNTEDAIRAIDTLKVTTFSNKAAALAHGARIGIGEVFRTEGYRFRLDGGDAYYRVTNTLPSGPGGTLSATNRGVINFGGSKYAILIPARNNILRVEQFGARANDTLANHKDVIEHLVDFTQRAMGPTGAAIVEHGSGVYYALDNVNRQGIQNLTFRGQGQEATIVVLDRRIVAASSKTLWGFGGNSKNLVFENMTLKVHTREPACNGCGGFAETMNFATILDIGGIDSAIVRNCRFIIAPEPLFATTMHTIIANVNVRNILVIDNYTEFGQMKFGTTGNHNIKLIRNYFFRPYNHAFSIVSPGGGVSARSVDNIEVRFNIVENPASAGTIFIGSDGENTEPIDTLRHVYITDNTIFGNEWNTDGAEGSGTSCLSFYFGLNTYDIDFSRNVAWNSTPGLPGGTSGFNFRSPNDCFVDSISCRVRDIRIQDNLIRNVGKYGFRITMPNPQKPAIYRGPNGGVKFTGNIIHSTGDNQFSVTKVMEDEFLIEDNTFQGSSRLELNVSDTTTLTVRDNKFMNATGSSTYAINLIHNRAIGRYSWMKNSSFEGNIINEGYTDGIEYTQGANYDADSSIFDLRIDEDRNHAVSKLTDFPSGALQRKVIGPRQAGSYNTYFIGDDLHADSALAITNKWKKHTMNAQVTATTNNGVRVTLGTFNQSTYNFDWYAVVRITALQQGTNARKQLQEVVTYKVRQNLDDVTSPIMQKSVNFYDSRFENAGTFIHARTSQITNSAGTVYFEVYFLGSLGASGEGATKVNIDVEVFSTNSALSQDFSRLSPVISNITHVFTTADRDHEQQSPGTGIYTTQSLADADANLIDNSKYLLTDDPTLYFMQGAGDTLSRTHSIYHRIVSASLNNADATPTFVLSRGIAYTMETTGAAASHTDINLPAPAAALSGKVFSARGFDAHGTFNNQIITPGANIFDQYGNTHTTYVLSNNEQVDMFVGQDPSTAAYFWFLTSTSIAPIIDTLSASAISVDDALFIHSANTVQDDLDSLNSMLNSRAIIHAFDTTAHIYAAAVTDDIIDTLLFSAVGWTETAGEILLTSDMAGVFEVNWAMSFSLSEAAKTLTAWMTVESGVLPETLIPAKQNVYCENANTRCHISGTGHITMGSGMWLKLHFQIDSGTANLITRGVSITAKRLLP